MRIMFYALLGVMCAMALTSPGPAWAPPAYPCQSFSDVWPDWRKSTNVEDLRALTPPPLQRKKRYRRR